MARTSHRRRLLRGTLFVCVVISRYPFDCVHVKESHDPLARPLNYSVVMRGKSASSSFFHRHALESILFTVLKPGYQSYI